MFTLKVAPEEESDDVDQGIQSYNGMLAAMGYAPDHDDDDDTTGDGTAHYNARAEIVTTGMDTNAAVFEPTGRGDDYI